MFCTDALWEPKMVCWGGSIPSYIVKFIRSICHSNNWRYTGHQAVEEGDDVDDDESVEDDAVNTLYEEIEEEASPRLVRCDEWKKPPKPVFQE